jgi:hypothetical protein
MSQPRVRGSGAGGPVRATRKETREQTPTPAEGLAKGVADARPSSDSHGQWAGDVRAFVDWCERASDLEAYRAALATVPPHDAWRAVSRTLHAEIEFTARPADTGPRARPPETFRTLDPDGGPLRDAKRRILEAEITRRAVSN